MGTDVSIFLNAGGANSVFSGFDKVCPITPGKEQEVVGVKVIPAGLLPRLGHPGSASLAVQNALWPFAQFSSSRLLTNPFQPPDPGTDYQQYLQSMSAQELNDAIIVGDGLEACHVSVATTG